MNVLLTILAVLCAALPASARQATTSHDQGALPLFVDGIYIDG